jgi:glucan biosynthesis protein C
MTTSPPLTEHGSSAPDGHPGTPPPASGRRYDLDWLRICAFGILILYHVGLFYVTWDSHVKSRYHSTLLEPLLGMVNSLALLFFVSGVAVRFTIDKAPLGKFLMERSTRLFVPLVFGSLVLCVPQSYVALRYSEVIPPGYLSFYRDYLGFGQYAFSLPDLHHLWYVAAILAYTLLTAACLPVLRAATSGLGRPFFSWLARGGTWRTLFVPVIPFVLYVVVLEVYLSPTDWYGWAHTARTLTFFLLGFVAAKNEDFWAAVDRAFPAAIGMSLVFGGLLLTVWLNQFELGSDTRLLYAALMLRPFYGWSMMIMLLGLARRFGSRPSRALVYLTAGVMPYYILHQTIIVVSGYWFTMHEAPLAIEAATIIVVTVLGCALGYEVIRRVTVLRPLFGLPLRGKQASRPTPQLEYAAR